MSQTAPISLSAVKATHTRDSVQIEVMLSAPVKPSASVTSDPARLILDFPSTTASTTQQHVVVNANGIRQVRYALYKSDPPVTRVVVDMDRPYPYEVRSDGNRVTLEVKGSTEARGGKRQVPATAASGSLLDIFRRRGPSSPQYSSGEENLKRPIPGSAPSAAHPNVGSLQQGTVYPGSGTPGTGNVPAGNASAAASSPTTTATVPSTSKPSMTVLPGATVPSTPVPATSAPAPASPKLESGPPVLASSNQPAASEPQAKPSVAEVATPKAQPVVEVPAAQLASTQPSTQPAVAAAIPPSTSVPVVPTKDLAVPQGGDAVTPEPATVAAAPIRPASNEANIEPAMSALDPNLKTVFRVKYVAEGVAYLDGGSSAGLAEGMKLEIKETDLEVKQGSTADANDPRVVAELEVSAVADTSSVTDIHSPKRPIKVGDLAYLSSGDAQALVQQRTLSATRKYPIAVTFTEDDPQDEEERAQVPRPPQPSVNRARGWIGFDQTGTVTHGSTAMRSSDFGLVLRADFTRIGGSYWNLTGYWRGRLTSRTTTSQPTLQDLINRTYHLGLTYENPNSRYVAGVGRLYLPWAPSLNTIDGGYFGLRIGRSATVGLFGGSTPDPSSWNYNPDQRIGGAFVNFQGGSYDNFFYTSTSGFGASLLKWQMDRPFVFFENTLAYKHKLSVYDSLQADSPRGNAAVPAPGPELSRNFLTVRLQVHPRVELNVNHNYFRDIPTFDPALIGTGLLDKYLFQGFSAGARIEVVKQVFVYGDAGRSSRSGDTKNSWNQMFGVGFNHLPWFGLRADAHYSRFNSSFGDGTYESVSVSRDITDTLRLSILGGTQNYTSTLASNNQTRFVNANTEWSWGTHYFSQGGFTINRGGSLSYDQWLFTVGYRFDSKARQKQ